MSDDDRRQALAGLENMTFRVPWDPAERLRERLTSPTFAITGKTCEEVLATGGRPGAVPFTAGSFKISGTIALEFYPGAAEALMEMLRPRCGALLFPLPARAPRPTEPVHPLDAPYFAPVQGPQPAACALDGDHRIGWHWDGRGTWFR